MQVDDFNQDTLKDYMFRIQNKKKEVFKPQTNVTTHKTDGAEENQPQSSQLLVPGSSKS